MQHLSPTAIRLRLGIPSSLRNIRTEVDRRFPSDHRVISGLHLANSTYLGDVMTNPLRHIAQLNTSAFQSFDIAQSPTFTSMSAPDLTIIGGGALLRSNPEMDKVLETILDDAKRSDAIVVGWSLGFSDIFDPWPAEMRPGHFYPTTPYTHKFRLLSLRDKVPGYTWVPCVSALHDAFDFAYPTQRPVGYYKVSALQGSIDARLYQVLQSDDDPPLEGVSIPARDTLSIRNTDWRKTIEFLGTSETIVTTSYHGAYWAILLGRKVIALDRCQFQFVIQT